MKRLFTFLALLIYFGSMAQTPPAIKSTVTVTEKTSTITYVNGITIVIKGSNTIATRAAAYKIAYAAQNPAIKWDIYTPENLSKMVGLKDAYVKIKPGIYSGQYWLTNFDNVVIDCTGSTFSTQGMEVFYLKGFTNKITFQNANVKNANRSFVITAYKDIKQQTGFTFQNITMENSSALFYTDGFNDPVKGGLGLVNNLTIKNVRIKNSPGLGTAINFTGDNFSIDSLFVDNVGQLSGEHSNIIVAYGQGKLSNSTMTNSRGSIMRLYPFNFIDLGKRSVVTNVLGYNSLKYGLLDFHFIENDVIEKYSKVINGVNVFQNKCDVDITNCTAGQLGTTHDWDATLADVYSTHSIITFKDNLGFNLYRSNNSYDFTRGIVNTMQDQSNTTVKEINFIYKTTAPEAVKNLTTFESLFTGVGYKAN